MTREQRIEEACKCLDSESARADFRKAAAVFADFSVFWDEQDRHAFLERTGMQIEFRDLT